MSTFDVLIVGGRPGGAGLAARLAGSGLSVLVLDRCRFPSAPAVPSAPLVHAGTMGLLDEIGLPESAYGDALSRENAILIEGGPWFSATIPLPSVQGRAYGHGIQRERLDAALWDHVAAMPGITCREGFAVEGLLAEGGRVVGVRGRALPHGAAEELRARWVIGADGRFSTVARLAGAPVVEEETRTLSTCYYAIWEGQAPVQGRQDVAYIYTTFRGLNALFFPFAPGKGWVCVHTRADRLKLDGDATGYYERTLRSLPPVARRLEGARRVTDVVGLKRIGNGYRQAAGPGWALVGDAVHYKDPVDGQGIYDALLAGKILAPLLRASAAGELPDEALIARYGAELRAATLPMYRASMERLARELYSEPPVPVIRTILRWMLQDPEYQDRYTRLVTRDRSPEGWLPAMGGVIRRGLARDLRRLFGGRSGPPQIEAEDRAAK